MPQELDIQTSILQLVSEIGMLATTKGLLREAEVIAQAIRQVRPDQIEPVVAHALVRIASPVPETAIPLLEEVLKQDPEHPRAFVFLAVARLKAGYRHEAFSNLEAVMHGKVRSDEDCRRLAETLLVEEFNWRNQDHDH